MAFYKESTEITGKTRSPGRNQMTRNSEATSSGPLGKSKPSCLKAEGLTGFPKRCHVLASASSTLGVGRRQHKANCCVRRGGWSWVSVPRTLDHKRRDSRAGWDCGLLGQALACSYSLMLILGGIVGERHENTESTEGPRSGGGGICK